MWLKAVSELKSNSYVRSILILVSGTAGAQAITILALPLLTRLYTPENFSVLAVYAALLGMVSVSACLRLDIAIPMPESDSESANLLALSLTSSILISILTGLVIFLYPHEIISLVNQPTLIKYLWLLPIGILLTSTYSALQYWATRKKRFSTIATSRMEQSISGTSIQLVLGWLGITPLGLIIGQIFSSGGGVIRLARNAFVNDSAALRSINFKEMRRVLKIYENFPKYSSFEALANTIGIQLPIIIIAAAAIGPEAGCLILAMKVLQAPLGLLGSAIAQVYLSRGPEEHRQNNLAEFTSKTVNNLIKTGVGPLIFAGIVAPEAFSLVFGEEWRRAGILAAWMTPWIVIQFISSPISMVMHIVNHQRQMLMLTFTGLLIRLGCILIAIQLGTGYVSEIYAISGGVFYAICFIVFTKHAGLKITHYLTAIKNAYPAVIIWTTLGIASLYIIQGLK